MNETGRYEPKLVGTTGNIHGHSFGKLEGVTHSLGDTPASVIRRTSRSKSHSFFKSAQWYDENANVDAKAYKEG